MITGGTGSFGKRMAMELLYNHEPKKLIIFSRDEYKQNKMAEEFSKLPGGDFPGETIRFSIGDVRDRKRVIEATKGVDYIFHAAAMKQVPLCEYNPDEAIKTNIIGAMNVEEASRINGIKKVIALSSDKAVNPINLYGATKLVLEKVFINGNIAGRRETNFAVVRYGNVLGSRGSVLEIFEKQAQTGSITITDKKMTRFWWTLDEAVLFVVVAIQDMIGGEIFIPKIKSALVRDLIAVVAPECRLKPVGIRPGEKLHECLIAPDEERRTLDIGWAWLILPDSEYFDRDYKRVYSYTEKEHAHDYTSDKQLMENPIKELKDKLEIE